MDKTLIGRALAICREQAGYRTQTAGAHAAGISSAQLSKWERGDREPSITNLVKTLSSWGMSLAEFESFALGVEGRLGPYEGLVQRVEQLADAIERAEVRGVESRLKTGRRPREETS